MYFPGREIKPYSEPVSASELLEGSLYFSLTFIDDAMLIPAMEPFIFVGRNLKTGDRERVYFQDIDSYRRGIRYESAMVGEHAVFVEGSENELGHFFLFESALDVLLACALRRKAAEPG